LNNKYALLIDKSWQGDARSSILAAEETMAIEDDIKKIVAEKLSVDIAEVVPEAKFVDDLGADSLDLVELVMAMEDAFGITISDDDAEKLIAVKDAIAFIAANKN
jgi:acyl carrier protein